MSSPVSNANGGVLTEINAWAIARHCALTYPPGASSTVPLTKRARRQLGDQSRKLQMHGGHKQTGAGS